MSDDFSGPIIMRFKPGPPAMEHDDIAEEYAIIDNPTCGPMVYACYRGAWAANVWNERPIIRHLLALLEESKKKAGP